MKKFVNDPQQFVPEMLKGIALANSTTLKYVPDYNLIMRTDAPAGFMFARSFTSLRRPVVRRDRDDGWIVRAVAPRVIGAALHDGVALRKPHFLRVEHQRDLALEDKTEVERARFLHVGVRRRRRMRGGAR